MKCVLFSPPVAKSCAMRHNRRQALSQIQDHVKMTFRIVFTRKQMGKDNADIDETLTRWFSLTEALSFR